MRKVLFVFLAAVFCCNFGYAKNKYYILKEDNINYQDQLNSIFLEKAWNSQEIQNQVLKLNKAKSFNHLSKRKKIYIPSPLKQNKCNFNQGKNGLIIFKNLISFEDEKQDLLKLNELSCLDKGIYSNYIVKKKKTPVSSLLYSIYLTPVWKKNGLIDQVKQINGISTINEFDLRTNYFIPSLSLAKGCNFYKTHTGRVVPLKLILSTDDKEEFALAFQCAPPASEKPIEEPAAKEEPEQVPEPPKFKTIHKFDLYAATNFKFDTSDVSDVEVDIVSAYGLGFNYSYQYKKNRRINFFSLFENYLEVKNRTLETNNTWKKFLNLEFMKSQSYSYTLGLFEQWYFDNIEVDNFYFTSSVFPYAGIKYFKQFTQKLKTEHEVGIYGLDILTRERAEYGAFTHNYIRYPLFGFNTFFGFQIDYTIMKRANSRNAALIGGLSF